jgi:phosphate:Na+ symporter
MTALEMFSLIAGLVGGLAMFLYGMNVMSGGLTKAAGGKLEAVLAKVTKHPIIAYLFGVGVTALVECKPWYYLYCMASFIKCDQQRQLFHKSS